MAEEGTHSTPAHGLLTPPAERGAAGLYQGFTAGLANNSISMALGFASYEVGVITALLCL